MSCENRAKVTAVLFLPHEEPREILLPKKGHFASFPGTSGSLSFKEFELDSFFVDVWFSDDFQALDLNDGASELVGMELRGGVVLMKRDLSQSEYETDDPEYESLTVQEAMECGIHMRRLVKEDNEAYENIRRDPHVLCLGPFVFSRQNWCPKK